MNSQVAMDRRQVVPHKALVGRHPIPSHDHRVPPHDDRVDLLAQRLAMHIESLVPQGRAQCLDVACGDITLAAEIHERAPRTVWRCIDSWCDGQTIPHADQEFDVALVCDLLHAPENAARLLAEAGRVARHVLVKDHFEQGPYSRAMLRLKGLVGVPERHLTREAFVRLVGEQGLVMTGFDCGMSRQEQLPVLRTVRKPEFIAVLSRV
jgi:hypothetical protein